MAGLRRAERLVVTADDATNLEVVANAHEVVDGRRGDPLDCIAHSADATVCALLKARMLERVDEPSFRVDFFNFHDQAARQLVKLAPPSSESVVMVGSGRLADHVLLQLASCVTEDPGRGRLRIVVVAPGALRQVESSLERHPSLGRWVELCPVEMPLDLALLQRVDRAWADRRASVVYMCDEDDDVNLAAALSLSRSDAVRAPRKWWRCRSTGAAWRGCWKALRVGTLPSGSSRWAARPVPVNWWRAASSSCSR